MRSTRIFATAGILALLFAGVGPAAAQLREGDWSVGVGLGKYSPADDGRLANRQGELSFAIDFSRRVSESFEWGFDIHYFSQETDTPAHLVAPLFGTLDRRASISASGFGGTAKWVIGGPAGQAYLGGGLGLYRSEMRVTGSVFGFPGEHKDSSMGLGLQVIAGASLQTAPGTLLGLEWRTLRLDANFGELTRGSVDIGGSSVMLSWRTVLRGF